MVAGLERVAEELMGRRRWRQYQKLVLREEDDCSMEAKDWEPEDNCKLCVDLPLLPPGEDSSLPTVSISTNTDNSDVLRGSRFFG